VTSHQFQSSLLNKFLKILSTLGYNIMFSTIFQRNLNDGNHTCWSFLSCFSSLTLTSNSSPSILIHFPNSVQTLTSIDSQELYPKNLKLRIVSKNYWQLILTKDFIGAVASEDLKCAININGGEIRFKGIAYEALEARGYSHQTCSLGGASMACSYSVTTNNSIF